MRAETRIALVLAAAVPLAAQQPAPNHDRLWIDATVIDSAGRSVPDLAAADFEIQHEGKPLPVAEVAYVRARAVAKQGFNIATVPSPLSGTDPDDHRLAVIVDDLSLSPEAANRVQRALSAFINGPEQERRLIAILRTSGGTGTSQQFTADRAMLQDVLNHVPRRAVVTDTNRDVASTGDTLFMLRSVLGALRDIPGRKTVVLLSGNMQLYNSPQVPFDVLTQRANRARVVFYAVDPRSFETPSAGTQALDQVPTYAGLGALARDTGGIFFDNTNDVAAVIARTVQDQEGYYRIVCPTDEPAGLVKGIAVRLKRADLRLRNRTEFVIAPAAPYTGGIDPVLSDLAPVSPFASNAISVRLTPLVSSTSASSIDALLHIGIENLTFTTDAQGAHDAEVEVVGAGFLGDGKETRRVAGSYKIHIPGALWAANRSQGVNASMTLPVGWSGPLQVEVIVRDANSGKIGSARQAFDFPDFKSGRLLLSGIFLTGAAKGKDAEPGENPAFRVFKPGATINYVYSIFNARMDSEKRAFLETRVRVFREGQEIYASEPVSAPPQSEPDPSRRVRQGTLHLLQNAKPAPYVLEVTVTDTTPGAASRTTIQTIDFEVR